MKNLKFHLLYICFILFCCPNLFSETVSQKYAKNLAQQFFNEARHSITPPVKFVYNGKSLTMDRLFTPFYVYNSGNAGFVIISAENKTFPILGYSLTQPFDQAALSDAQKALLASYARDIEYVRFESDIPEKAIEAWRDFPQYVKQLLNERPVFNSPLLNSESIHTELTDAVNAVYETSSDIYSPEQWTDLIDSELMLKGDVVLGFPYKGEIQPTAVTGKQGDYYRFYFDGDENWMMRILSTELLSGMHIAVFGNAPVIIDEPQPDEEPFEFLDAFYAETRAIGNREQIAAENYLTPKEPEIFAMTGGRFVVDSPYKIDLIKIYNLSGSLVKTQSYRDTNYANIDISELPNGFYVAAVFSGNNNPHSFKIYR